MRRWTALARIGLLLAGLVWAQGKGDEQLQKCARVLNEILDIPDGIPRNILDRAQCVAVFPDVSIHGFESGAASVRGAMTCRSGANFSGPWGAPAMYSLQTGDVELKFIGRAADFVLLIMNAEMAKTALRSNVVLRGNLARGEHTAAPGPMVKDWQVTADRTIPAEILTYRRSRGIFGGVSLEGCVLRAHDESNATVYGRRLTAWQIVRENAVATTPAGAAMTGVLNEKSPRNLLK